MLVQDVGVVSVCVWLSVCVLWVESNTVVGKASSHHHRGINRVNVDSIYISILPINSNLNGIVKFSMDLLTVQCHEESYSLLTPVALPQH